MTRIHPLPRIDILPFSEIDEPRDVALVFSRVAWEAVAPGLRLNVVWRAEAVEATVPAWEAMAEAARGDVVYAVGGGLAVDAAKFVAARRGLPLVSLPTALSVDAFLTWASGYRDDGCVRYVETKPPDVLVADFRTLGAAPESIRAAGVCDTLSIATGCWDWAYAERRGDNPPHAPYNANWAAAALAILQETLDCAEAAGAGDPEGLKRLLDCLAMEVQLCNLIGHSRPEEGSEHYFAYAVENVMGKGLPHGDLVGPGIVLMAERQGQDVAPLRRALRACRIPLDNIPKDAVERTLRELPDYCRKHKLPRGIAHGLND